MPAVPFWIVKAENAQCGETGARRKNEKRQAHPLVRSSFRFFSSAISRALSTIQQGTACSLPPEALAQQFGLSRTESRQLSSAKCRLKIL